MVTVGERKKQIENEIAWLRNQLKTVSKTSHYQHILHQIRELEYNLSLGIF